MSNFWWVLALCIKKKKKILPGLFSSWPEIQPAVMNPTSHCGTTSPRGILFPLRFYFLSVTPEILAFKSHRCAFSWGIWMSPDMWVKTLLPSCYRRFGSRCLPHSPQLAWFLLLFVLLWLNPWWKSMPRPFRLPNCSFSHLEISWSSKSHHHVLASLTCVPRIVQSAFIFNLYLSGAIQARDCTGATWSALL